MLQTFILGEDLYTDDIQYVTSLDRANRTHVDLSLELGDGLHGARSDDDHSTVDLLTLDTTEEGTHVVTSLTLFELSVIVSLYHLTKSAHPIQLLVEHL